MPAAPDLACRLREGGLSHLLPALVSIGVEDLETLRGYDTHELMVDGLAGTFADRKRLVMCARCESAPPVPSGTVSSLLQDAQLEQHIEQCRKAGVDSLGLLAACSDEELEEELGFKLGGHRKKLRLRLAGSPATSPTGGSPHAGRSPSLSPQPSAGQSTSARRARAVSAVSCDEVDELAATQMTSATLSSTGSALGRAGYSARSSRSPDGAMARQASGSGLGARRVSGGRPLSGVAPDRSGALHVQRSRAAGRSTTPVGNDSAAPTLTSTFGTHQPRIEKTKKVNVFENGRYCDPGGSRGLWQPCKVPGQIGDMQVVFNVLTRALGWHRKKDDIYRQTDDTAGGREVTKLWAFNGRPLVSPDEVEDGMWLVAGTGHQTFISPGGAETSWTKKSEGPRSEGSASPRPYGKAGGRELSVFDRLSDPKGFTGTAQKVHGTITVQARPAAQLAARSGGARGRQADKLAEARAKARAPAATTASAPPTIRATARSPASSAATAPGSSPVLSAAAVSAEGSWDSRKSDALSDTGTWDPRGSEPPTLRLFDDSAIETMSSQELVAELERGNKKTLLGWQKCELLGKGSFGTVYSGKLSDGTVAAVKICSIPKDEETVSGELGLLLREVTFMREFDHDRIVKCYGCLFDAAAREVQIFLELMPGGSVAGLVSKRGKLAYADCQKYTKQLLEGLRYLHERKVVHRDVKGDNLLLDAQGNAHIADFGTSKQMMDTISAKEKGCATMVGTPYWMAPEVIRANPDDGEDGQYGAKADIWSVGCTLVEMLTGKPPWAGQYENMWSAIFHIAQSTEPPPTPDDIPAGAKQVLRSCFRRTPSQRPSPAQLLKEEPWLK
eukprot:TRINITY_DN13178_c0_g3_i1.p1 TRINITY_DN13178_c0_g3~~TRINITY_DN13178_c0_g3_i1.p1  ORF type:complete len:844 (+),score=265.95 TRINITY_DN13178_c0_g3_i1:183-2714(+)